MEFHLFNSLPKELRLMIWELSVPDDSKPRLHILREKDIWLPANDPGTGPLMDEDPPDAGLDDWPLLPLDAPFTVHACREARAAVMTVLSRREDTLVSRDGEFRPVEPGETTGPAVAAASLLDLRRRFDPSRDVMYLPGRLCFDRFDRSQRYGLGLLLQEGVAWPEDGLPPRTAPGWHPGTMVSKIRRLAVPAAGLCSEDLTMELRAIVYDLAELVELIIVFGNGPGTNAPPVPPNVLIRQPHPEPPAATGLCRPGWALAPWDKPQVELVDYVTSPTKGYLNRLAGEIGQELVMDEGDLWDVRLPPGETHCSMLLKTWNLELKGCRLLRLAET
ncbi:hypothetical protein PspLS_10999 [Pyricularia sp. CBS 133598]|nr:hypothetical protein PspLS_10999 [Pyricularia sp. CBS 133598]